KENDNNPLNNSDLLVCNLIDLNHMIDDSECDILASVNHLNSNNWF
ncbi:8113_t:CDS:1, partial [Entrophospora sp. SA101]